MVHRCQICIHDAGGSKLPGRRLFSPSAIIYVAHCEIAARGVWFPEGLAKTDSETVRQLISSWMRCNEMSALRLIWRKKVKPGTRSRIGPHQIRAGQVGLIVNVLSVSKPQLHAKTPTLLRANECWMTPHIAPEIMLMVEPLGSGVAPGLIAVRWRCGDSIAVSRAWWPGGCA
jgi:hypothetical protein